MKFVLTFILLSLLAPSFAQKVKKEKIIFNGETFPMLVLNENNDNYLEKEKLITLNKVITPIEEVKSTFEIRQFTMSLGGGGLIKVYKILNNIGYLEIYNYEFSKYRNIDTYPDSLGINDHNQILLRKISTWQLNDSTTKKILIEFMSVYVTAMRDQTNYLDSIKRCNSLIVHPCKGISDCWDVNVPFEIRINNSIRKFTRVGLDYYRFNKQLRELERNPRLYQILNENILKQYDNDLK